MSFKTVLNFLFTATICALLSIGTFAAKISGEIETERDALSSANSQKLLTLSVIDSVTKSSVSETQIESISTVGKSVIFEKTLPEGVYNLIFSKKGYLDYTVENVLVYQDSDITLPKIKLFAGDIDSDNEVSLFDLALSLRAFDFGENFTDIRSASDIDESGEFGILDFGILKKSGILGKSASECVLSYENTWDKNPIKLLGEAFSIIDDVPLHDYGSWRNSGWDYYFGGGGTTYNDTKPVTLTDISANDETYFKRDFYPISQGNATLDLGISPSGSANGVHIVIANGENAAFEIYSKNNYYYVKTDLGETKTSLYARTSDMNFRINADIDKKSLILCESGNKIGVYPFESDVSEINRLYIKTGVESKLSITVKYVIMYANYIAKETFVTPSLLPYDFKSECTSGAWISRESLSANRSSDIYSISMNAPQASTAKISKSFEKVSGKMCFEIYFILPTAKSGAFFTVSSGGENVLTLKTVGDSLYTESGEKIRYYTENLWHILRMELDTVSSSALIKINGKTVKTVPFDNPAIYLDEISFGIKPDSYATMKIDDITVFQMQPEPLDYCPEPQVCQSDDYIVGVNVCNLWRNGHHAGWECVSAYDELTPYLGYYDEGSVEVADWEIKFMSEHGIDYQAICWYAPGNCTEPIKKTGMYEALIDGYMNAKYSDKMNFNIMWENNSKSVSDMSQFKNYLVPYIMEYFFKDERYQKVDNKPVLMIWSYTKVIESFGGEAGALEAMNYLRSECVKEGFDGCLILFADGHNQSAPPLATMKRIGGDATYAYHWNQNGADPYHQIYRLNLQHGFNAIDIVPTVSVGFNNIAWSGTRKNMLDPKDYGIVTDYIKNTFLPYNSTGSISKMAIVSTWNEYGEGTFVMPTNRYGFGYLDGARKAFGENPDVPHTDVRPTENQLDRLTRIYPQEKTLLRYQDTVSETDRYSYEATRVWDFSKNLGSSLFNVTNISNLTVMNGLLRGNATNTDPILVFKEAFNLNADDVDMISLTAKFSPSGNERQLTTELFFITAASHTYDQAKSTRVYYNMSDDFIEVNIPLSSLDTWTGTVTGVRIDPMVVEGSFEISKICFKKATQEKKIYLNENLYKNSISPYTNGSDTFVAVNPQDGFFGYLNAYYEYNRKRGELLIKTKEHTLVLTVGSDVMLCDNESVSLSDSVGLIDGLPIIPLNTVAKALGYSVTDDGTNVRVISPLVASSVTHEWNFDSQSDGFTGANADISQSNGALVGTAVKKADESYDPYVISPQLSINAKTHNNLKIRLKQSNPNSKYLTVYYATEQNPDFSEDRAVQASLSGNTVGVYSEYLIDFSSQSAWSGKITSIRIDPIDADGSFYIDYIQIVPVSGFVNISNGDAEGTERNFNSPNAIISVKTDPQNPNNHVWSVDSTSATGKRDWTYIRHNVHFTSAAQYKVEFRLKVTGSTDGNTNVSGAQIHVNLRYTDSNNKVEHIVSTINTSTAEGWKTYSGSVSVGETVDSSGEFTIYSNPLSNCSVNFMVDDIKVTRIQ